MTHRLASPCWSGTEKRSRLKHMTVVHITIMHEQAHPRCTPKCALISLRSAAEHWLSQSQRLGCRDSVRGPGRAFRSTSAARGTLLQCTSRIWLRPATSGLGTVTCLPRAPAHKNLQQPYLACQEP